MDADVILSQYGLSRTNIRTKLITLLMKASEALSTKEIEQGLGDDFDRVTLYRTIKLFEEKNLIHKIVIDDHNAKYRLVNPDKGLNHPHFHCTTCDKVVCLPQIPLPECDLPVGFSIKTQNTLVEGKCQRCNNED